MPRPAEPSQVADRDKDRLRKLAKLRARLQEEALALRTPADWARCLRLAALMPGEEFANILLIAAQRPGATMVRDYRQWASMGRQVRRREKGIEVFAIPPRREQQDKEKPEQDHPERSWRHADRITHLWDLSQTTGPPLAIPATLGKGSGRAAGRSALASTPRGLRHRARDRRSGRRHHLLDSPTHPPAARPRR